MIQPNLDRPDADIDTHFMRYALVEAQAAYDEGEVPVGAVVVLDGRIVGRGHNQTERLHDPTAHAEMIALTAACETANNHRLNGATLYVTLEPCLMCCGAMVLARVARLVYAATDPKTGCCGTVINALEGKHVNHKVRIEGGVMAEEAAGLLRAFFRQRRG